MGDKQVRSGEAFCRDVCRSDAAVSSPALATLALLATAALRRRRG